MELRGLWLVFLLLLAIPGVNVVSAFEITPSQPVKGDMIVLSDTCTPGASVPVKLEFTRIVSVSGGEYIYDVGDIEIPSGTTLSVRADGVEDMKLAMKVLIWLTITVDGSGGVASYGTSIISGKKKMKVYGDALSGASSVTLRFTAATNVDCDSMGDLLYTYDSEFLPLGPYTISVGGSSKVIELYSTVPGPGVTSTTTSSTTTTTNPFSGVVVVANDIDYGLNLDLINILIGRYSLPLTRQPGPGDCTLILGGPDAYDGVGSIVQGFLSESEENAVRVPGAASFYKKGNVFILGGSDRDHTRGSFVDNQVEVAAYLNSCWNNL